MLCPAEKENEATSAGADYAGLAEYVTKIEGGWADIDVVIATPSVMPKIAKLGKILGLGVHAGHGLNYETSRKIFQIKEITELNIGHFFISEALFFGIANVLKKFNRTLNT